MSEHAVIDVRRSRRRAQAWGATLALCLALVFVGVLYLYAGNVAQDRQIGQTTQQLQAQGGVIDQQNDILGQVCRVAGGQINTDRAAREVCRRVEQGLPAVPSPVTGQQGTPGIGVAFTRQIDRCFIEVGLTSGNVSRFGSFCGADGPAGQIGPSGLPGETGTPGPTGSPGIGGPTGPAGVGVADVRTAANKCFVDVVLTDASTRTVGPFCGPPPAEYIETYPGGGTKRCVRSGGTDLAPGYSCVMSTPSTAPTTTPAVRRTVAPTSTTAR